MPGSSLGSCRGRGGVLLAAAAAETAALGPGDGGSFHSVIISILNLRLARRSEKINEKNRPCRVPTSSERAGF